MLEVEISRPSLQLEMSWIGVIAIFCRAISPCARRDGEVWRILIPVPQSEKIAVICVAEGAGLVNKGSDAIPACGICRNPVHAVAGTSWR